MKVLSLLTILLLGGCVTGSKNAGRNLPSPPFVEVYYDNEHLGTVGIEEGRRTQLPFDAYVDSGTGEKVGLGTEIIADHFTLRERYAMGHLEVTTRWIDPDAQASESPFPIFSVRSARSRVTLIAESSFHVVPDDDGKLRTGYDLEETDGWRFLLVTKTKSQRGHAVNDE